MTSWTNSDISMEKLQDKKQRSRNGWLLRDHNKTFNQSFFNALEPIPFALSSTVNLPGPGGLLQGSFMIGPRGAVSKQKWDEFAPCVVNPMEESDDLLFRAFDQTVVDTTPGGKEVVCKQFGYEGYAVFLENNTCLGSCIRFKFELKLFPSTRDLQILLHVLGYGKAARFQQPPHNEKPFAAYTGLLLGSMFVARVKTCIRLLKPTSGSVSVCSELQKNFAIRAADQIFRCVYAKRGSYEMLAVRQIGLGFSHFESVVDRDT